MAKHVCPYGIKAKWLLERKGFDVEDHHLKTREETDAFKSEHDVATTPQTFISGERIGGYDDLQKYFSTSSADDDGTTYTPVIMIFTICALLAIAIAWTSSEAVIAMRTLEWFAALAMTLLAVQKLTDVERFSTMFLNYDLLARQWVPYAYLYAFGEAAAGILMLAGGMFARTGAPIALFIGTVGAISVFKAVYIDKRELKCACVGGNSNVPLGFVSLTENLVMIAMGVWMLIQ